MTQESYLLTESVGPFRSGQRVTVVARYGEWHLYDLKLAATDPADDRFVELTTGEFERVTEAVSR